MPKLRTMIAVVAALGLTLSSAAHAAGKIRLGKVKVRYDAPADDNLKNYKTHVESQKVLEGIADSINAISRLPTDLTLTAAQCGEVNAFYDPTTHAVTLCYELVAFFDVLHTKDNTDENGKVDLDEIVKSVDGAIEFVMYHEVGHALINLLDLPITGREEDAVDQLATVVLINADDDAGTEAALNGAYTFLLQGQAADESTEEGEEHELAFWDEHSLDPQRFYNITCWVYGSDPEAFSSLVEDEAIPQARAERCPGEWQQTSSAWTRLLAPHIKEAVPAK
jgi:hypothetical protein